MTEQIAVQNIDLSWITITGDDAETTIDASGFVDIPVLEYHATNTPSFCAKNGKLPQIAQLFNTINGGVENNGVHLETNSSAIIHGGCGVKSSGVHGLFVLRNSRASAASSIFTNSGSVGMYASGTSTVEAEAANVSNATQHGFFALGGSSIGAASGNASNVGGVGVLSESGSSINFENGTATNTALHAVFARYLSNINARGSNCSTDGSPTEEYAVTAGGELYISGATGGTDANIATNTLTASGIIYS